MITAIAAWALILLVCLAWRALATSDVRARLWQLVCGTKRQRGKLRVLDAGSLTAQDQKFRRR